MRYMSTNVEKTTEIASEFAKKVAPRAASATVVGLYGDLGAGKTCFMQGAGLTLGVSERMVSPTFVIEKIYKLGDAGEGRKNERGKRSSVRFSHLIHIDAYRIEKSEEIVHLGWQELVADPKNLICVEWPQRIADIMPPDHIKINFEFLDENTRAIEFENFEIENIS